jgi:hypothetical protein
MSSLTNVNNNAAVVVIGRTAPVPPGQQTSAKSIPVVLATDQTPVPVIEQNKIQSEVALSLLGIPRAEVALGIFADVNTYDVNPSEWANTPVIREDYVAGDDPAYTGFPGIQGWGLKHIPEESGALIEAPADKFAVLTSKRFFRYQPGRVSSATFGVKTSVIPGNADSKYRNPAIRKYGIFDNFDGYYWETRDTGKGDQLAVVRRTTSIITENNLDFITEQTEDYGKAGEFPSAANPTGTAGDLVILRDGLVHTHAAVYDPSLLLDEKNREVLSIDTVEKTITLSSANGVGILETGQCVSYHTDEASDIFTANQSQNIYRVINVTVPDSSGEYTVKLVELEADGSLGTVPLSLDALIESSTHILRTPVPFIFPTVATVGAQDIMFPYKRGFGIENSSTIIDFESGAILPEWGINTSKAEGESAAAALTRMGDVEIRALNSTWANWVKQNVKPEHYKIYEYRVPRTRFSGDFVNGIDGTAAYKVRYSDVVRTGSGDDTIKLPGELVRNSITDLPVASESIWDIDFTKVIMQKIEFSWYGAVGALFLAYVPVSNGEARWVRVHHMRASNQLKVASLGNATLPITYLVYGGGSEKRYGYENTAIVGKRIQNSVPGSGSYSQYITKYGASYYIDGGDRGTVRLFSYSSDAAINVYGSKYLVKVNASQSQANDPYLTVIPFTDDTVNPAISDFYIGASVITGNIVDRGTKVSWVDGNKLYLSRKLASLTTASVDINVIVDRPQIIYGIETKREIISSQSKSVRNRVQVYPTQLSVGASGSANVSLKLLKNPIFQTFDTYEGTTTLAEDTVLASLNQPTTITLSVEPTTFSNDASVYGWFRGFYTDDNTVFKFPILGLLRKVSNIYTFTAENSYSAEVKLTGTFLYAGNYGYDESGVIESIGVNDIPALDLDKLARLSSININNEPRTPIPGTGTQVTTFYVSPGSELYNLSPYFDYNKDYLSYPLTNKIDTLYMTSVSVETNMNVDTSGEPDGNHIVKSSILASLTWEEQ